MAISRRFRVNAYGLLSRGSRVRITPGAFTVSQDLAGTRRKWAPFGRSSMGVEHARLCDVLRPRSEFWLQIGYKRGVGTVS